MTTHLTETDNEIEFPANAQKLVLEKISFNQDIPTGVDITLSLPYSKTLRVEKNGDSSSELGGVPCLTDINSPDRTISS